LNRQLISNLENIGLSKVQEAKKRAFSINKAVQIIPIEEKVDKTNIQKIAMGCDIVFDCSDNVPTRLILEEYCEEKNLPLIHGAIGDLCGQVAAVYPGDRTLSKLYKDFSEKKLPTVSYVPALVASLQVSEGVKALIGESQLRGKTMIIDLSTNYIKIIGSEEGR
jgi:molybdopterin/thiamine biosynthesis adenylyltransferase